MERSNEETNMTIFNAARGGKETVLAHEPKAYEFFVNDLLYTDESELKDLNQNEFVERLIAVATPFEKYQGQLQQPINPS